MALPTTGQLSLNDINVELGNASGSQASLRSMSSAAGFTTPDQVSDFYGYSAASLSLNPTLVLWSRIDLGDTINVTANAGNSWSVTLYPPWVTITGGSGSGNGSFDAEPDRNDTGSLRIGYITVESDAPTASVECRQSTSF